MHQVTSREHIHLSSSFKTHTYLYTYRRLRKLDHGQLVAHLCLALLGVNFMLVFQEVNKPLKIPALCLLTDIILLYFTAVVLLIMASEAVHMCYELILLPRRIKHFVLKSTFVSWGMYTTLTVTSYILILK